MVKIAHASIDENGHISGGQAGNQNGKELCTRTWYSKPWSCVIRFKDPAMRQKIADCMLRAVNNPRIGYDQNQRNTLLSYARNVGYDPYKVTALCETDCSALVTLACIYAGVPESALVIGGNSATTSTLRKRLEATGLVDVFKGADYTMNTDKLIVGDILLSEGHHVAVVVDAEPVKTNNEIAHEVIDGKWGVGAERKRLLTQAGYDYREVQAEVNKILKGE